MQNKINKVKKRIKQNDWIVAICFGMMLVVKFATIFQFVLLQKFTGASINAVATTYEAVALFRMAINLGNIGTVIAMIVLPAFAVAYYLYIRRKVLKGDVDVDILTLSVQFVFFALIINAVNDLAGLFGLLVKFYGG